MEVIVRQLQEALRAYASQYLNNLSKTKTPLDSPLWSRSYIPYEVVAPFLTPGNLAALARQKISRRLLVNLSRNWLWAEDRFLFWEDILSAIDIIPTAWRAEIWLDCTTSSEYRTPRERNGGLPYYSYNNYDREKLSNFVVSSKWLVDAPLVRKWYCRLYKPGFELLNYMVGKRESNYPLRDKLQEAIRNDDLPSFALLQTMHGKVACRTLLKDVLTNNASTIFTWLVENNTAMIARLKPYHLMVYAAANLPSATAIHVIKYLKDRFPGTLASRDIFGNNLLWYCLHNKHILWFSANSRLVSFLCDCGCRRDSRNHLGLSFDDISKAITAGQKKKATKHTHLLSSPESWDDAPTPTP